MGTSSSPSRLDPQSAFVCLLSIYSQWTRVKMLNILSRESRRLTFDVRMTFLSIIQLRHNWGPQTGLQHNAVKYYSGMILLISGDLIWFHSGGNVLKPARGSFNGKLLTFSLREVESVQGDRPVKILDLAGGTGIWAFEVLEFTIIQVLSDVSADR